VVIRPYEERDERGWLICRLSASKPGRATTRPQRTGDRRDEIRRGYSRVHDDVLYEKRL
jgi:hypothetical protein